MSLVQNRPFFQRLFLGNIGRENVFQDTLEGKKLLSRVQKQKVEKMEKWTFCQRG